MASRSAPCITLNIQGRAPLAGGVGAWAAATTHGADRSGIALAAAWARVRAMEEESGAPLLIRSRTGVRVTAAGQTLLYHARRMLEQSARLREDLSAYAQGAAGEVRL